MADDSFHPPTGAATPALDHVRQWVFDLDNTLYPSESAVFRQVDQRMGEYIANLLGLAFEDARRVQKTYFHTYGTTLRGLMVNHGIEPAAFLEFVHDIDVTVIDPAPALDAALGAIEGPKSIFTNASRAHALQVIERLGVAHHFEAIFDIHDAGYVPKPDDGTFDRFIASHAIRPAEAVLFEDTAANLAPAAARGMTTVLVTPGEDGVDNDANAPHVQYVTDDLAGWIAGVGRARIGRP